VPLFHGTNYAVALEICENGFAALQTTDVGFFGKGITSSIQKSNRRPVFYLYKYHF